MYTYTTFESAGSFILLRPVFITLAAVSLILFAMILFTKFIQKAASRFAVLVLSIISVIVSAQLLFYEAVIADELGLKGDAVSTYLFLINLSFCLVNPILFYIKSK